MIIKNEFEKNENYYEFNADECDYHTLSILDDIDMQMDNGFADVSNNIFNADNSEMRKVFNISRVVKGDVFDVSGKEIEQITIFR